MGCVKLGFKLTHRSTNTPATTSVVPDFDRRRFFPNDTCPRSTMDVRANSYVVTGSQRYGVDGCYALRANLTGEKDGVLGLSKKRFCLSEYALKHWHGQFAGEGILLAGMIRANQ